MKRYFIYKIYYDDEVVYIGRTKRPLAQRIREHLTKGLDSININPQYVTKIEYAECKSEADMMVYEVYYINTFHPSLNTDALSIDELTITLPELSFTEFYCSPNLHKWKKQIADAQLKKADNSYKQSHIDNLIAEYRRLLDTNQCTQEEYELLVKQAKMANGIL